MMMARTKGQSRWRYSRVGWWWESELRLEQLEDKVKSQEGKLRTRAAKCAGACGRALAGRCRR